MTIDEAIKHAKEIALVEKCEQCAKEHEQLAEWLEELKFLRTAKETMYREIYNKALEDLFDKTLNVISNNYNHPYLGDAIYGLVNDALVDAIGQLKK